MKQPTPGWDGYSPAGKQSWAFLRTAPFEHLIRGLLELQARPASCNRRPRPARTCSLPFRGARGPRPGVPRGEGTARLHRSASRFAGSLPTGPAENVYRLRDAAPDKMSAADWPGQNSSPEAEAGGQDTAPRSKQKTPSAAMAPGGHVLPLAVPRPGSAARPRGERRLYHGNAKGPT